MEAHICILWGRELQKAPEVYKYLSSSGIFITKVQKFFIPNLSDQIKFLKCFYYKSETNYLAKANRVDAGSFIVFELQLPGEYEVIETSREIIEMNAKAFNLKNNLRNIFKTSDGIHLSDSSLEANLQKNILHSAFSNTLNENLFTGYRSLEEFKKVINAGVDYFVTRKPESFSEESSEKDIDILTTSRKYFCRLGMLERKFTDLTRCLFETRIQNKEYLFDLREIYDEYYPAQWATSMMHNKKLNNKYNIYSLNDLDQYYALTYHCFVHKKAFPNKYAHALNKFYNSALGRLNNNSYTDLSPDEHRKKLISMMRARNYYPRPCTDTTVCFEIQNILPIGMEGVTELGNTLVPPSRQSCLQNHLIFELVAKAVNSTEGKLIFEKNGSIHSSRVYAYQQYVVKITTPKTTQSIYSPIQEAKVLELLNGIYTPKVYWWGCADIESDFSSTIVVQDFIKGNSLQKLVESDEYHFSQGVANNIIAQLMNFQLYLNSMQINHCDLHPGNIILSDKFKIYAIDFGLAHFRQSNLCKRVYAHASKKNLKTKSGKTFNIRDDAQAFQFLVETINEKTR